MHSSMLKMWLEKWSWEYVIIDFSAIWINNILPFDLIFD